MLRIAVILMIISGCMPVACKKSQILHQEIEVVVPSSACEVGFVKNYNVKFYGLPKDDHEKIESFKKALLNPENKVVWALRGGYGASDIIELMYRDKEFINDLRNQKNQKWFVGYSDITSLHIFLSQEFGWKTVHGPVFKEVQNKNHNIEAILKVLSGKYKKMIFNGLIPLNSKAINTAVVTGKLTGGNISIVQTSIGTKWQIKTKDKIVFLEDWHEKPYRILRMVNHLKMAGIFNEAKAIVIGDMCDTSNEMKRIIENFAESMNIPIYSSNFFGHGIYNYPMIYNSEVVIGLDNGIITLTQTF